MLNYIRTPSHHHPPQYLNVKRKRQREAHASPEDPGTRELRKSLFRLARSAAAQAEERKADAGTGPSSVDEQLLDGGRDDDGEEAAPADTTAAPANGAADLEQDLAFAVSTDELSMSHPGFTSEAAAQYLPRRSLFRWKLTEDV